MKINIIIPTLGGNRGFKIPRYLIKVGKQYVIENIIKNLNFKARFIFIISYADKKKNVDKILKKIEPGCKIIIARKKTKGILQTLLLAKKYMNKNRLIISNCDHFINLDKKKLLEYMKDKSIYSCILTYLPRGKSHCFLKFKGRNVLYASERKKVSNIAAAGVYYIQNGLVFKKYIKKVIRNKIVYNNIYYLSAVYNEAIKDNKKIIYSKIKKMNSLGSPNELKIFIKKKKLKLSNFKDVI